MTMPPPDTTLRTTSRCASWLLLLLSVALLCSCTAVLDFTECESDSDCDNLTGEWTCQSGECVEQNDPECRSDNDCTEAPLTSCQSGMCVEPQDMMIDMTEDMDMSDMSDVDDTDTVDIPTTCSTDEDCRAAGDFICGDEDMCVSATTEQCHTIYFPDGNRDSLVYIGSIIPSAPPFDEIGVPLERAVRLAVQDFNSAGGLPDGRKIALVTCDSLGSSELAQAAATHLVDVLGVPAIIGPVFSTPFIDVTTNIARPAGVLTITPTATSPSITGLSDDGLAWRVIASDVFQGNAIVDHVADQMWSKMVVLAKNDAYGNGLLNEVSGPLSTALGTSNVYVSNYEDPVKLGGDEMAIIDEFSMRASGAISAMPDADVVLIIGTTEAVDLFKIYLLGLQSAMIMPPPVFLFSHGAVPAMPRSIEETNDGMLAFVQGISPDIFDPDNYAAFNLRYRARFNDEDPITSTSLSYDATFVVLFAMSALPDGGEVTGTDIAAAISKLVDKSMDAVPVSFGDTNFIATARNELSSGGTVDLQGVSGELDFDLETGDVRTNYINWGVEKVQGVYSLTPLRSYILNPEPAEDGIWMDVP